MPTAVQPFEILYVETPACAASLALIISPSLTPPTQASVIQILQSRIPWKSFPLPEGLVLITCRPVLPKLCVP